MYALRFLTAPIEGLAEAAAPEAWAGLADFTGGAGITVCGPCSSSLDVAWRLIGEGDLAPWESVLAPVQWAGRGQLGRTWISEPGNLFAALAWPAEDRDWSCLTPLVAGYLVAEYLAGRGIAAWLKWPNDVLVAASGLDPGGLAKAGGILVEERGGRVLAGIGLNLVTVPDAALLRRDRAIGAARLAGLGVVEGPLLLWDRLVNFMRERYEQLQTDTGPRAAVRLIQARLAWLGERVAVAEGAGEPYAARISGLAPDGGLILAPDNGGEKIVYGGQIARLGE